MKVAALCLSVLALVAITSNAWAKEGVTACLDNPAALRAPAGTLVSISWTLRSEAGSFGASGIYIRLRGTPGHTTKATATSTGSGRFRARVRIPQGGVRSAVIGLRGWKAFSGRKAIRADVFFPIVNLKLQ